MRSALMLKFVRGTALDDAPWKWGGAWTNDMPEFFSDVQTNYPGSDVMANVYDTLDDSPATWHYGAPVDPTAYQGEYLGNVIGIY